MPSIQSLLLLTLALGTAVLPVRASLKVWQIGTDSPPGSAGGVYYAEFGATSGLNEAPPGKVTRLSGDPLYNAANNPVADDDFYFTGTYPIGFNGLTSVLTVPNDEPAIAWERSLTQNDRTNRLHFPLTSAQVTANSWFRLTIDLPAGGISSGGFGSHDIVVRFKNSSGSATQIYSAQISGATIIAVQLPMSSVAATVGANTIEIVRDGPAVAGLSYWNLFDHVRLEVNDNLPPVPGVVTGQSVNEGASYALNLTATDTDTPAGALVYGLISGPAGLTVSDTGAVAWSPTEAQGPSANTVVVRVTDDGIPQKSATNQFTVTVAELNVAPAVTAVATTTLNEQAPLAINLVATDSDLPANVLSHAVISGPAGLTVSAAGQLAWTPTEAQGPSTNIVAVRVTDNGVPPLSATNQFTVIVREVATPPVWAVISEQMVNEQTTLSLPLSATDNDLPANTLTYSLLSGPAGLTVSGAGLLTWTPTEAQGPVTSPVVVRVTDNGTPVLSATNQFEIVVREVNLAPVLPVVPTQVVDPLTTLDLDLPVTDADLPANALTFARISGPSGLTISAAGQALWAPSAAQGASTNTVVYRVSDNGSPSLSATNQFTVITREVSSRFVWQIGIDNPPLPLSANYAEFSQVNYLNDAPPGSVTRLPGDPEYVAATNPGVDDDFYFAGVYPPGFNGLTTVRVVPNDEPFPSWERSHTLSDPTNRFHFRLNSAQIAPSSQLRFTVEFPTANLTVGGVGQGFGDHDIAVRFRNGSGFSTLLYSNRVSQATNISFVFPATSVLATLGPNSMEVVRSGRVVPDGSYTITYDFLRLEADPSGNNPPVPTPVAETSLDELAPFTLNLMATDSDVPAQALTFQLLSGPAGLTVNPAGQLNWTPTEAQGPSTNVVAVRVTDSGSPPLETSYQFTLIVRETNAAPVLAAVPLQTINELVAWSLNLSATDSDLPVNSLTFAKVGGPAALTVSAVGLMQWTPSEADGPGTQVVTVKVTDNGVPARSVTNQFSVVIQEVNLPPVVGGLPTQNAVELTPFVATLTFSDPDLPANSQVFSLVSGPTGLVVSGGGQVTWTPSESQGPSSQIVTVRVTDGGSPNLSATNSFTLVVAETNSAPVLTAVADVTMDELTPLSISLSANDADLPANSLSYGLVSGPSGLAVSVAGLVTWTPTEGQGPSTNVVTVQATDNGVPAMSDSIQFTVFVREVNLAPVSAAIAAASLDELTPLSLTVGATDADLPSNALTFTLISGPPGLTVAAAGSVVWTPTEAQGPSTHTVAVRVTDNGVPALSVTNEFSLEVREVNTTPVLIALPVQTVDQLTPLAATLTATDSDVPANALTFALVSGPVGLTVSSTGAIDWSPPPAYNDSTNTVVVKVTDNGVPFLSATNQFTVIVALPDTRLVWQIGVEDDPGVLPYVPDGEFGDSNGVVDAAPGAVTRLPGDPAYNAATNPAADGHFYFQGTYPAGYNSLTAALAVPSDEPSSAWERQLTTADPSSRFHFILNSGQIGLSSHLHLTVGFPSGGTSVGGVPQAGFGIHDLEIRFRNGLGVATVVYASSLSLATEVSFDIPIPSVSATLGANSIELIRTGPSAANTDSRLDFDFVMLQSVSDENTPPLLGTVADLTVDELTPLTLDLEAVDSDTPRPQLLFSKISGPTGLVISAGGQVTWTPTESQGPATRTVVVRVTDDGVPPLSATNQFNVIVREVNTAPSLAGLTIPPFLEGTPLDVTLAATDADLPANTLTFALVSGPSGLQVSTGGQITWTPDESQGPSVNTVAVKVTDNGVPLLSVTNFYAVTVLEENLPANMAAIPAQAIDELTPLSVALSATDPDIPAGALTFSLVSGPAGLTVSSAGIVAWTPTEAQGPSTATVTVRVTDNGTPPASATNQFTVTVREINTAPFLASIPTQNINAASTLSLNLSATDADLPANALSYALLSGPAGLSVTSGGLLTWSPGNSQTPSSSQVRVRVTDNGSPALSHTNQFTVVVTGSVARYIWAIGTNNTSGSGYVEFFNNNGKNDARPGLVTRLPGDPLYVAATNPTADDDFYTSGSYSSGFNGLTATLPVPNDEPWTAWESSLTQGDRTNRLHFVLTDAQVAPGSVFRFSLEFSSGSYSIGGVVQGPSVNDIVINFRNAAGVITPIYVNQVVPPATLVLQVPMSSVAAAAGPNSIEIARTGPVVAGTSYWIHFDWLLLEVDAGGNIAPVLPSLETVEANESIPVVLDLGASDDDTPAGQITHLLLSGPSGSALTTGGQFTWTPSETHGGTTAMVVVKATDKGIPPLSTTNQYTIIVREVNLAPTLAAVPLTVLDTLTPLSLTLSGSDPDVPANLLSYSLVSGPAGITVSPAGAVNWMPTAGQIPSTSTVAVRITDNGDPALSATNQFTVVVQAAVFRTLWMIGVDDSPLDNPYQPSGEFTPPNSQNDLPPGQVTRLAGDPQYNAAANPSRDDDFYFSGIYPAGFNGLTAQRLVPFDEPFSAWESALTQADRTNRFHFRLDGGELSPSAHLRLSFEFISGSAVSNAVTLTGFSEHDVIVRFKSGLGQSTLLYSNRVSQPSQITIEIPVTNIVATLGANTIEFVRTGPNVAGVTYALGFDYVRLEADRTANSDGDADGLPLAWETDHQLNDTDPADAASDADQDGLTALQEYNGGINSTDPNNPDTDWDGLADNQERALGTNPLLADTDGDGLTDFDEVNGVPATSPLLADTDGDGAWDNMEKRLGTNPINAAQKPTLFRGGIGISFVAAADLKGRLAANQFAGVVPQLFWNQTQPLPASTKTSGNTADIASPLAGRISRSDGTLLPNVTVNWTSADSAATYNSGSGDRALMNGMLRATSTTAVSLTVSNVPFAQYDLYVLVGSITDGYRGRVRLGTDTSTDRNFLAMTSPPQADFLEIPGGSTEHVLGNLVRYPGLTSSTFTLNVAHLQGNANAVGLHAIQIVDSNLDGDASGIPDWWETKNALEPGTPALTAADSDGDGLTNLEEYLRRSNPRNPDSDGDGLGDGQESAANTIVADSDGDGLTDFAEVTALLPSNPNLTDSDADGVSDANEVRYLSDPGYKESNSPTFTGWTPRYTAGTLKWEWNLENVQLVWDHGAGSPYLDENNENHLVNLLVRNSNGVNFRTFQMGLRYYKGGLSYRFYSEPGGGFSAPSAPGAGLRDLPTGGRVQDLTADLGFSGYGPADISDRLQFRMVALRGTGNSWTLTFELRNQTRNKTLVLRTYENCTAAASVDAGSATWMDGEGNLNRAGVELNQGMRLYFTPTVLESHPQFAAVRDTDNDGMPDVWEDAHGLNKNVASDAESDRDNDNLSAREEWLAGTNPRNPDTDGDEVVDGMELNHSSNPLNASSRPQYTGFAWPTGQDLDGDGLPDAWEVRYRAFTLSPNGDADGDGQSNSQEALWGTNPFDAASKIALTFTPQAPDVVLSWPFQPLKKQSLFWKTGTEDWVRYSEPPLSENGISQVVLEGRLEQYPSELYRVDTLDQDSDGDGVSDWAEGVLGSDPYRINSVRSALPVVTSVGTVSGSVSGDYANFVEQLRPTAPTATQKMSRLQAARFLQQATFGPTPRDLDRVQQLGYGAWIDDQISQQPPSLHSPYVRQIWNDYYIGPQIDLTNYSYGLNGLRDNNVVTSFARAAIGGPDQLRQRVAFALSQILVTSRRAGDLDSKPLALDSYYDIFVRNAFANYADVLREVTFHPVMGLYLSHMGNQKAIPEINQYPDENFAREVQQLFTIGLWELNQDGSRRLNAVGQPIPTYSNREITEFARVFTGWWYGNQLWGRGNNDEDATIPMEIWADRHDFGRKVLLNGFVVPARTPSKANAVRDVDDALRNLMEHPNTGPFIGRQLIQFLVTSNPSSNYVARISAVFANNGAGRRGDLGAVVKAILLDPEARDPLWLEATHHFGRLKEPVHRAMNLARVGHMERHPKLQWWSFAGFYASSLQEPSFAPSVFNFFRPNYQPPGLMAQHGLVGPAFQITDSYSSISFPNKLWEMTEVGFIQPGYYAFAPDYQDLLRVAEDAEVLLDEVNLLFCGGLMSAPTRQILLETLEQVAPYDRLMRTQLAVYLAASCPEGAVQR